MPKHVPLHIHRFIPTLVGNTGCRTGRASLRSVHPHARGEHRNSSLSSSSCAGSSPRSWGTLPVAICAKDSTTVHPHARGEHGAPNITGYGIRGSSPRSWGTPHDQRRHHDGRRFIPTLVGNTATDDLPRAKLPVHPHARGEHVMSRSRRATAAGSSPRSWGTRVLHPVCRRNCRFIPTLVGNTCLPTKP